MKSSFFKESYFHAGLFFISLVFWLSLFGVLDITRAWTNPSANPPSGSGNITSLNDNVGISNSNPQYKLDVNGTLNTTGFRMGTGAVSGRILTSDVSGVGTWQAPALIGIGGSGSSGYMPKFTGVTTLGNSLLFDNGTNIGIGTASPGYNLDVIGDIHSTGWVRTDGVQGWYSQTYGGGWHMTDTNWLRAYGSKNIWTEGILGGNTGLTVGYSGTTPPLGGAVIAGNVLIGKTTPGVGKLEVEGVISHQGSRRSGCVSGFTKFGFLCIINTPFDWTASFNQIKAYYTYAEDWGVGGIHVCTKAEISAACYASGSTSWASSNYTMLLGDTCGDNCSLFVDNAAACNNASNYNIDGNSFNSSIPLTWSIRACY